MVIMNQTIVVGPLQKNKEKIKEKEVDYPKEELCKLQDVEIGKQFLCPWNGKVFKLVYVSPSAAWVEVTEEREIERKNPKTGEIKRIIQKITKNEPWSRTSSVKAL